MELKSLLTRYDSLFFREELDVGHADMVTHYINLVDEVPFKQRHRRIPPAMYQEVKDHVQNLLVGGIIRKSHSPGQVIVSSKEKRWSATYVYKFQAA